MRKGQLQQDIARMKGRRGAFHLARVGIEAYKAPTHHPLLYQVRSSGHGLSAALRHVELAW